MKRKKLPVLMFLFVVVLLLCLWQAPTAEAATIVDSGICGDNITWTLDDEGTLTISGTGPMENWSLWGSPWYNNTSIKTVVIGDGITSIGENAFYECWGMNDVYITDPSAWCKITFGNLNSNPMLYADRLYFLDENGNEVTEIALDESVTQIPDYTFKSSNLTSVTIPDSVISIGRYAFFGCTGLTSVTIPDSVTSIGECAFSGCTGLTSVTIPGCVTSIGGYAFSWCTSLTSITISEGVISIEYGMFYDCTDLTLVTIPDSVTSIGIEAFYGCYRVNTVYYAGSRSQWNSISIGIRNGDLTSANVLYNHIHDYTLIPPVRVEPTCTEDGSVTYTCQHGETKQEIIPALGHIAGSDTTVVVPTCTGQGYTVSTCTRCGGLGHSDFTESLGHNFSGTVTVVPPTCVDKGYTATQCIRCTVTNHTDYTDELGHKLGYVPAMEATCTTPGLTHGTKCECCNYWGLAQTHIPKLGHDFVDGICTRCQQTNSGDMDGDDAINDADAMYLLRHTLFPGRYPLTQDGDVNSDGTVNDADAMYLLRYTLFPTRYPLYPKKN